VKRPGGFDRGFPIEPAEPEPVVPELVLPAPAAPVPLVPSAPLEAPDLELRPASEEALAPVTSIDTVDLSQAVAGAGDLEPAVGDGLREADVRGAKRQLRLARKSRRTREKREQRRFTAHLRRRRRYWIAGIASVLGLAAFVAAGVFTPVMAVREVRIEGAEQVDVAALQQALQQFDGVPLALVDDQQVHAALQPFTLIERYSIERIPPQTLLLRIEERDAVIALARDSGFGLYDAAGVQIGSQAEAPVGMPIGSGALLDPATDAFRAAGRIIRDLPEDLRAMLVGVEASSAQQVTLVLESGTRVVWGSPEQTQRKAVVLRSMIAKLGAVATIDVSAPETPVFTK